MQHHVIEPRLGPGDNNVKVIFGQPVKRVHRVENFRRVTDWHQNFAIVYLHRNFPAWFSRAVGPTLGVSI